MEGHKVSKDLSFKPVSEPILAQVFKIKIRDTEYVFDEMEEAKLFKLGYENGLANKEPISMTKSYKCGYQVGANDLARGSKKENENNRND